MGAPRALSSSASVSLSWGARRAWRRCTDRFPVRVRLRPSTRTLTTWPSVPNSRMRGTNVRMPCSTPIRLTPSTASQSSNGVLPHPPAPHDPGVVADEVNGFEALERLAPASRDLPAGRPRCTRRHRGGRCRSPRPLVRDACSVDVGHHDLHAFPSANACAIPRPFPLAAPVTTATRPLNSCMAVVCQSFSWSVRSTPRMMSAVNFEADDGSEHACSAGLGGQTAGRRGRRATW